MALFTQAEKWYLVSPEATGDWASVVTGWNASNVTFYNLIYKLKAGISHNQALTTNDWESIDITDTVNNTSYSSNLGYWVYVESITSDPGGGNGGDPPTASEVEINTYYHNPTNGSAHGNAGSDTVFANGWTEVHIKNENKTIGATTWNIAQSGYDTNYNWGSFGGYLDYNFITSTQFAPQRYTSAGLTFNTPGTPNGAEPYVLAMTIVNPIPTSSTSRICFCIPGNCTLTVSSMSDVNGAAISSNDITIVKN
jgi:hypothetical protein